MEGGTLDMLETSRDMLKMRIWPKLPSRQFQPQERRFTSELQKWAEQQQEANAATDQTDSWPDNNMLIKLDKYVDENGVTSQSDTFCEGIVK